MKKKIAITFAALMVMSTGAAIYTAAAEADDSAGWRGGCYSFQSSFGGYYKSGSHKATCR